MNVQELSAELIALKAAAVERDRLMDRIREARTPGGLQRVFPGMFPEDSEYSEPMVANMIDVAAKDTAEVLAAPPTLACRPMGNATDRARAFADKRTKINYGYFDASNASIGLARLADWFVMHSFGVGVVRPDFDRKLPIIQFIDPYGCYPVYDQWGRTKRLYQAMSLTPHQVEQRFPELAQRLRNDHRWNAGRITVVKVYGEKTDYLFSETYSDMVLHESPNPTGECMAHAFERSAWNEQPIGSYDDVLSVQVAKARFAALSLEAASKSVGAPLAIPMDVQELNFGRDAVYRSSTPREIGKVPMNIPPEMFAQQSVLDSEIRNGSRYPETRTGNTDASIITGRGVQALGAGFDSQIKSAQTVFAHGLTALHSKAMKMDETIWPDVEKTIRGNRNGTPYELKYTPGKDIKGDYSIEVQYGLMAGLQPNQALVFGLQARGDNLISREWLRSQLPIPLDGADEAAKIEVEQLRDSLLAAFAATAQAIPQMAQGGQAPSDVLRQMSAVIEARLKGKMIEQAMNEAFQAPEPEQPALEPAGAPGMGQPPAASAGPPGAGAPMSDQGGQPRPDMMQMIASLSGGAPNLGASVIRRQEV